MLVSTIFFTIIFSFFNLRFDLFSVIAKKSQLNQEQCNVVCIAARTVFIFSCALTTGWFYAFQHIPVFQSFTTHISRQCYFFWLCWKWRWKEVRDHRHVTGKFRGAAHWSWNINLQLTKKVPIIFHNLRGYDTHLVFDDLKKFDVKIDVIPNGLKKYMAFILNKNLYFIDSMQFMNSSLEN